MNPLRQFLYFTKPQIRAVIGMVILILLAAVFPTIYNYFFPVTFSLSEDAQKEMIAFQKALNEKRLKSTKHEAEVPEYNPFDDRQFDFRKKASAREIILFKFNPNTIGFAEWVMLGFSEKQAESIERLKATGFKFRKAEDLAKVRVIGEKGYERLKNFVDLPDEAPPVYHNRGFEPRHEKPGTNFSINLNAADTFELIRLRGIGAGYARRIFKYRTALGGFHSSEQLREVWGLPDSVIQQVLPHIVIDDALLVKLSLNHDEQETFAKHPYIKFYNAKRLDAYRKTHNGFRALDEAQKALQMGDSAFLMVKPYLKLD